MSSDGHGCGGGGRSSGGSGNRCCGRGNSGGMMVAVVQEAVVVDLTAPVTVAADLVFTVAVAVTAVA